jgi:hypothetical protein
MRRALLLAALLLPGAALAQEPPAPGFIEILPSEGRGAVRLALAQVVRIGRAEGHTVVDTAAWVQQRSVETVESLARRVAAGGVRLVPLTDPSGTRTWLAADRVVLVRESQDRHAAGARAAIVMVGLRMGADVAVRETPEEVMAALRRVLAGG